MNTKNTKNPVGIVGVPPLEIIAELNQRGEHMVDLDELQVRVPIDRTANRMPRAYCAILRTVVLNAMHLKLDRIYMDVGPGKCDCALHVSEILADMLDIPVIRTRNEDSLAFGTPLCTTSMPLIEKFSQISKSVQSAAPHPPQVPCQASCGFWGVPPRDFSLLASFPDDTHVFGWARCMENKTPADLALEHQVDPDIPMIFFSQAFCAKAALARHLADRHPRAIVLDCDVSASSSTRAKIEAFLELSGLEVKRSGF